VLAVLCLFGARIRFFLRPELSTLLIAPTLVWIFIGRDRWSDRRRWLLCIAVLMVIGANFHGGALIVPPLLAGLLLAELVRWRLEGRGSTASLGWGLAGLAVASTAPILNPNGLALYTVPFRIARLVDLPQIPNPEWISPLPSELPTPWVALAVSLVVLVLRERDPVRWMLFLMASVLALRYVRNVGLFFMLLPIALAPALATLTTLNREGPSHRRPVWRYAALAVAALIVLSMIVEPGRAPALRFSRSFYPIRACDFIEESGFTLPRYNDVRFGGYLIHRYFPPHQVFLDDRNEIHEPLLSEIYSVFQRSDPGAWQQMLDRYGVETALLRYNPPFTVARPDGQVIGRRGFSTLWFPAKRWALVYWDDVAMVFVDRKSADDAKLREHEYLHIRPDDVEFLRARLATDPEFRSLVASDLARKLHQEPGCERAYALSRDLLN